MVLDGYSQGGRWVFLEGPAVVRWRFTDEPREE